jgi:hypothetical protein
MNVDLTAILGFSLVGLVLVVVVWKITGGDNK